MTVVAQFQGVRVILLHFVQGGPVKNFLIISLLSLAFVGFIPFIACDKHVVDTPFPPPTATPTNTPVLVNITISGSLFSPAPVTIFAGTGVILTNTDPWKSSSSNHFFPPFLCFFLFVFFFLTALRPGTFFFFASLSGFPAFPDPRE